MATAKSVITIDVNDSAFKAFSDQFNKFQQTVAKTPGQVDKAADRIDEMLHALNDIALSLNKEFKKLGVSIDEDTKKARNFDAVLKDMVRDSAELAKNFASTAFSISKWLLFGGIGAVAGFTAFGDRVADQRRQAQQLGVKTGDFQAAQTTFGPYVDVENVLGNISNIKNNPALRGVFNAVGINDTGKDAAELLPEFMRTLAAQYRGVENDPTAMARFNAQGLNNVMSFENLRAWAKLTSQEQQQALGQYGPRRAEYARAEQDERAFTDFMRKMKDAGMVVENAFIKALAPLAPEIGLFAKEIANLIAQFAGSGGFKKLLDGLKEGLREIIDFFQSGQFKSTFNDALDAFDAFMDGIKAITEYLPTKSNNIEGTKAAIKGENWQAFAKMGAGDWLQHRINFLSYGAFGKSARATLLDQLEEQRHLPKGVLKAIWGLESDFGRDPNSKKPNAAGAMGDFGFIPKTADAYGVWDRNDFTETAPAAAKMMRDLIRQYKGDVEKALAAYNWGAGNLNKDIAENGANWKKGLPAETQNYVEKGVKLMVQVNNNTGGSAHATIAAQANASTSSGNY